MMGTAQKKFVEQVTKCIVLYLQGCSTSVVPRRLLSFFVATGGEAEGKKIKVACVCEVSTQCAS